MSIQERQLTIGVGLPLTSGIAVWFAWLLLVLVSYLRVEFYNVVQEYWGI